MEIISIAFSKIWESFWSLWPKSFLFLVLGSAIAEAVSVAVFRVGGNRGWMAVLGYFLGFLTVAFYAESQKYANLSMSYPIWLAVVAILVSLIAFLIFHDQFSTKWLLGFILTIIGIFLIQTSFPES